MRRGEARLSSAGRFKGSALNQDVSYPLLARHVTGGDVSEPAARRAEPLWSPLVEGVVTSK